MAPWSFRTRCRHGRHRFGVRCTATAATASASTVTAATASASAARRAVSRCCQVARASAESGSESPCGLRGAIRAELEVSVFTAWRDVVANERLSRRQEAKVFGFGVADRELLVRVGLQPW